MKVLFLHGISQPICGIAAFTAELARHLAAVGGSPTVGLAWGSRFYDPALFEERYPDLPVLRMDARTGTEEGRVQAVERAIRKVRPDVLVVNVLHSAFEAVRRTAPSGARPVVVAVNHGTLASHLAALCENRDAIDHIVTVNRSSYEATLRWIEDFDRDRIHYIPNGVPEPERPFASDRPDRIGYVGRLDRDKGFDELPDFFRTVTDEAPSAELWIAGAGELEGVAEGLARSAAGRVRFLGPLSREALYRDVYPELSLLVHLSRAEGWSLTMGEAMAHGVIPVSSNFRGVRAEGLLKDGENCRLFPVGEPVAGGRIAARLLEDPRRIYEMRERARDSILPDFSIRVFRRRWAEFLGEVLQRGGVARPRVSRTARYPRGRVEAVRERARRWLGRRFAHSHRGEEWPHFRARDRELVARIKRSLTESNG